MELRIIVRYGADTQYGNDTAIGETTFSVPELGQHQQSLYATTVLKDANETATAMLVGDDKGRRLMRVLDKALEKLTTTEVDAVLGPSGSKTEPAADQLPDEEALPV